MTMNKSHFYDPLYDFVTFEEAESGEHDGLMIFRAGFSNRGDAIQSKRKSKQILPFLDTVEVNRLNFLRQSGLAFLVYPSSTHTRFAHSIGSCYLGFIACGKITMQAEKQVKDKDGKIKHIVEPSYLSAWLEQRGWREEFLLALLLHDLGHFPFSHTMESNLEFWESFPNSITHEELTCELIQGSQKSEIFKRYKEFVEKKIGSGVPGHRRYKFVSELVAQGRRKGIDANILCYLISGDEKYMKVPHKNSADLNLVHHLVSGLLDLDRIDHYRRDSYHTGLKFGSNLNFSGLLGGMTLHYYVDGAQKRDVAFELRLSPDAIGHALTLLHSKERLVHDCFEHPLNVAYDAMLHRAINIFTGVGISGGRKLDDPQVDRAYELFFLTDDELLAKLMNEGCDRVKDIVFRIQNRRPFTYLGKGVVKPKKNAINSLRTSLMEKSGFSEEDIVFRPSKHFESKRMPTEEWMQLHYLFDSHGNNLIDDKDYEEQIRYFERVQDYGRNVIWFFTPDPAKSEKLQRAIKESEVDKYVK